jgi:hypothetical protein
MAQRPESHGETGTRLRYKDNLWKAPGRDHD